MKKYSVSILMLFIAACSYVSFEQTFGDDDDASEESVESPTHGTVRLIAKNNEDVLFLDDITAEPYQRVHFSLVHQETDDAPLSYADAEDVVWKAKVITEGAPKNAFDALLDGSFIFNQPSVYMVSATMTTTSNYPFNQNLVYIKKIDH